MSRLPPRLRHALVCVASMLAAAGAPASAGAAVSVTGVQVSPSTTVAGAHPNLTVTVDLAASPASDDARDLSLRLPAGLLGNPNAAPACPQSAFASDTCASASRVGSVTVQASDVPFIGSMTAGGDIYLVAPGPGEVARLGIWVRPQIFVFPLEKFSFSAPVSLHSESDYGLEVTLRDLPRSASGASLRLTRVGLTLSANGSSAPFMTNPTSCVPATIAVTVTSYDEPGSGGGSGSFTPTECATQPFTTSLAAALETSRTDTPTGVAVTIGVGAAETPRRNAHLRTATVALPQGMTLNPALGEGLEACTDAQLGAGGNDAPGCPAGSVVGTAEFATPILGTFAGEVYFGAAVPGDPYRLMVHVPIPGGRIKLVGSVSLDPATGRVSTTFNGLPQVPFTTFTLRFRGGSRGVFVTPTTCGSNAFESTLVPWSRLTSPTPADAHPRATASTSHDGAGAPCPASPPFSPTIGAALSDPTAAAASTLALRVERPDRDARISTMVLSLPPGLVGSLGLKGLDRCPDAAAVAAACPASSRIGSVQSAIGPGATPPAITGSIFLTDGRPGDLAGLSIHLPGRLGPVDVGDVLVGARLVLRPGDLGIDVVTDPLPELQGGIPVAVRAMDLLLDRPGFIRNPTRCGEHPVAAQLRSTSGATAQASASVTITGCERLAFGPRLDGAIGEAPARGSAVPVDVAITVPDGHATMRRAVTTLPRALEPNIRALGRACPAEQADAGTCPASSVAGTAKAVSPLLDAPLTGPVRIVKGTGALPVLRVELGGPVGLTLTGTVTLGTNGAAITTFDGVPDLPLTRFELSLDGGADGLLLASSRACAANAPLEGRGDFTAHSGATATSRSDFAIKGCRNGSGGGADATEAGQVSGPLEGRPNANIALHWRRGRGQLTATVWAARGRRISMASISLPSRLCAPTARGSRAFGDGKRLPRAAVRAVRARKCRLVLRSDRPAGRLTAVVTGVRASGRLARSLARRTSRKRLRLRFGVVAAGETLRVTVRPS